MAAAFKEHTLYRGKALLQFTLGWLLDDQTTMCFKFYCLKTSHVTEYCIYPAGRLMLKS